MLRIILVLLISLPMSLFAQDTKDSNPPYHQIPDAPEAYSPQTVLARTIDGLGYRYYWATKDLRPEDLEFLPGNEGRPTKDVLNHLHGLVSVVLNAVKGSPNVRLRTEIEMTWEEKRTSTLEMLKEASDLLVSETPPNPEDIKIIFQRGEQTSEFALWTLLNGPLADAIYHTGQIVSFRRSSGNPTHPGVSVFAGKTKE